LQSSARAEDEEENIKVIKLMHAVHKQVLIALPVKISAIEDWGQTILMLRSRGRGISKSLSRGS
jgi:hypothetical protein